MEKKIKIVYFGTNEFSSFVLEGLLDEGYNVIGVVTQTDALVGRKKIRQASAVKKLALKYKIDVFEPISIRKDFSFIIEKNPDLIITCAYGQIIPEAVLEVPKYESINVHGSLLPKLRGAAPIQYAILNDEKQTGITIMEMVKKMDAGGMYCKASLTIDNEDTGDSLFIKMSVLARDLLLKTLPKYINKELVKIKQNENEVTFAPSFKREDERVDFNDKRRNVYNKIRALNSNPGAYALLDDQIIKLYESVEIEGIAKGVNGEIVRIEKDYIVVKVSDGLIGLKTIQPASRRIMSVRDYLNANKDLLGKVFKWVRKEMISF